MIIAAIGCTPHAAFDDLCLQIALHDPTGVAGPVVERLLGPVVFFIAVAVGGRLLRRLLVRAINRAGGDPQVRTLVQNVLTAATYVFAVLAGLVAGGLDITILLTFGGLASLAVGLAFQDVLRNLLAGIFLLVEKPFRLGDRISIDIHSGVVDSIELRTTTLRTADGRLAILPNLTAFNSVVVNESAFTTRLYTVQVRVPPEMALEAALRAARPALAEVSGIAESPPPAIVPRVDGEAGAILDCRYWVDYRAHDADAVGAEVARRLWEAVRGEAHGRADGEVRGS